ncbi:uncharacterized protein LOC142488338 isoform X2 [Ascaphus truei]|uniref:uncharacterized protein LOC142488338 isoform X2 n=1 Tax=Ascaphus truei TaxID=8439 RepID=UPI003F59503B
MPSRHPVSAYSDDKDTLEKLLLRAKMNGMKGWSLAALQRRMGVLQRTSLDDRKERQLIIQSLQGLKKEQRKIRAYMEQSHRDILGKLEEISQGLFPYEAPIDYSITNPPEYIAEMPYSPKEEPDFCLSIPSYDTPSFQADTPVTKERECTSPLGAQSLLVFSEEPEAMEVPTVNLPNLQSSPVCTATAMAPDIQIIMPTLQTTTARSPDIRIMPTLQTTTVRSPDNQIMMPTLKTTTAMSPDIQKTMPTLQTTTARSPDNPIMMPTLKTTTAMSPDIQIMMPTLQTTTSRSPDNPIMIPTLKTTTAISPDIQIMMPTFQPTPAMSPDFQIMMPTLPNIRSISPEIQIIMPTLTSAFLLGSRTTAETHSPSDVELYSASSNSPEAPSEKTSDSTPEFVKLMKRKKLKGPFSVKKVLKTSATLSTSSKLRESTVPVKVHKIRKGVIKAKRKKAEKKLKYPPVIQHPSIGKLPSLTNGLLTGSTKHLSPPAIPQPQTSSPTIIISHSPPPKMPKLDASYLARGHGPCLPDIEMCHINSERIEKLYVASQGSLLRFAGLVFRSLVPLPTYLQWCHMANYNGTHQKRAIPVNVKNKLLSCLGEYFFILGRVEKQQIRDGVNNQLRNPRKTNFHPGVF